MLRRRLRRRRREARRESRVQNAHAFVFFEAGSEGAITLFELNAKLGDFFMQMAVGMLKAIRRGDESGKGVG